MNKLTMWNGEKIVDKIALCMLHKGQQEQCDRKVDFFLTEVLKDIYKDAELLEDFYSLENLNVIYNEYEQKYGQMSITIEQLQQEGWILVMYGRWSMALDRLWLWENVEVGNEYEDAEAIRFLIWLKKKSRKIYRLKLHNPKEKLKKWEIVYPKVPDMEWFIQNNYIICDNYEYFAFRSRVYTQEIDKALAELWIEWENEKPLYWMSIARALQGTYYIFDYLPDADKRSLFLYIQNEFFYKMDIPDWKQTNRFYTKKRLFEATEYFKCTEKYEDIGLWCGNRVLDQINYNMYGFEYYRWENVHEQDSFLILYPMILYMQWGEDRYKKSFCEQIQKYDKICQFYMLTQYHTSVLYEMLITKGTFYMAFRQLLDYKRNTVMKKEEFDNVVVAIVEELFQEGCKQKDYLDGQQIGMCLFEVANLQKNKKLDEDSLLVKMVDLVGKKSCFEIIWKDILEYFQDLLKIEKTVDWVNAYNMIWLCVRRWFWVNLENQKFAYFAFFLELVWDGYKIIFQNAGEYVKYIKASNFDEALCYKLYETYIQKKRSYEKRKLLFPQEVLENGEKDIINNYYCNLLEILYNILNYQEESDKVVKSVLVEVLERSLLKEDGTQRAVFDYSNMQIFSAENIVAKCIALLSSDDRTEQSLMDQLLENSIPDLLVYFEATTDQKFKMKLKTKIDEKASKDSLVVFNDARAIDIVINNHIESLYLSAEKLIEKKLAIWKERKIPDNTYFVKNTIHQKWRLKYVKKDYKSILEGDNKFFKAIVYTDVEEYKNFKIADTLWRSIIESKDKNEQFAAVYLNYLYLLNMELSTSNEKKLEKDQIEYANSQLEWICNIIETEKIQYWNQQERENYVWFVVQNKRRKGEDYLLSFFSYKDKYQISTSADEFIKNEKNEAELNNMALNNQNKDISNMFQLFWAQSFEKKAFSYYQAKGINEITKIYAGKTLLIDAVLTTCDVLYNYGPQLINVNKKSEKKRELHLYEDNVTMLFREVFNHSFDSSIKLSVHDQQKMGTTGHVFGGVYSPAEIDLIFQYDDGMHEIVECFVLADDTSRNVFKDHMGKIIGNNTRHEPLSFMLIYGKSQKSDKMWDKYTEYIQNEFCNELTDSDISKIELLEFKKAAYYIQEFEYKYRWMKVLRQKIIFGDGREQEVLHIYVDLAKNLEANIRNNMSQG